MIKAFFKKMINKIKTTLQNIFGIKKGEIELSTGEYEIIVPVKISETEQVYYEIEEFDFSTCSYIEDNSSYIVSKNLNGFLLDATVKSNKAIFKWKVK